MSNFYQIGNQIAFVTNHGRGVFQVRYHSTLAQAEERSREVAEVDFKGRKTHTVPVSAEIGAKCFDETTGWPFLTREVYEACVASAA